MAHQIVAFGPEVRPLVRFMEGLTKTQWEALLQHFGKDPSEPDWWEILPQLRATLAGDLPTIFFDRDDDTWREL